MVSCVTNLVVIVVVVVTPRAHAQQRVTWLVSVTVYIYIYLSLWFLNECYLFQLYATNPYSSWPLSQLRSAEQFGKGFLRELAHYPFKNLAGKLSLLSHGYFHSNYGII